MKMLWNKLLSNIEEWCQNHRIKIEAKDWEKGKIFLPTKQNHKAILCTEQPKLSK